MTDTLDALIERLERAEGPSENLDWDILAQFGNPSYDIHTCPRSMWTVVAAGQYRPLSFSASLDAALSLVPEGWTRSVDATVPRMGIDVCLFAENGSARDAVGVHKHEAIATCIAALKARREPT